MNLRPVMIFLLLLLGALPAFSQPESADAQQNVRNEDKDIPTRHDIVVVTATKTETRMEDLAVSFQLVSEVEH